MRLLFIALLAVGTAFGATGGAGHPRSITLNTNLGASRLGPTYDQTNGTLFSDLAGVSDFAVFNGSSLGSIAVTFPLGNANCTTWPAGKEFSVPASTGFVPNKSVAINKYACARSKTGSSITSGNIELTVW